MTALLCLLSGCSDDDTTPRDAAAEIRFNADVWRVMEGTRAETFDNAAALQDEGAFTCIIYNENSTTVHYPATQVDWSTDHWAFHDVVYRWPATDVLDFFAYMPATPPSYITDMSDVANQVTYAARNPQFKCANLPMTNSDQSTLKEFVYALTINQDKAHQGTSGVTMNFSHPFARITLQLSSTQEDIHINSITFKGIKNYGSCSFDGSVSTWTPSGDATDFVATLNDDYEANDEIGTYIMIPQDWAGEIEVNADWTVWGENGTHTVTTNVPTTWVSGYSYTYTFTITATDLKVDTSKFTEQW